MFVNGADAKAAQLFTLAHELAHVWVGAGGVVSADAGGIGSARTKERVETLCNRAAAEFLIPADLLAGLWPSVRKITDPFRAIARAFNVSPAVAARRAGEVEVAERSRVFAYLASLPRPRKRRRTAGATTTSPPRFASVAGSPEPWWRRFGPEN